MIPFSFVASAATGGWWPIVRVVLVYVLPWVIAASAIGACNISRKAAAKQHDADQQKIGAVQAELGAAVATAKACSDGVRKLRETESTRLREVAKAVQAAARFREEAEKRALATLQITPTVTVPADATVIERETADCVSGSALNRQKLVERSARRKLTP